MYITILEFPAPLWNRQGGWHLINTSKMGQPPTPEKKKKKLIMVYLNSGPWDFLLSKDLMIKADTRK